MSCYQLGDPRKYLEVMFFTAPKWSEFYKSYSLIGSWSGRNFLAATAGGIRSGEQFSSNRQSFAPVTLHRRLINASLYPFTFKWQGKPL